MTIVYRALEPHSCPSELFLDVGRAEILPCKTIARCRCGAYYYVTEGLGGTRFWHPVRWFNFGLKKRIKNANT